MYHVIEIFANSFKTRFALAPNAGKYIQMLDDIVAQLPKI